MKRLVVAFIVFGVQFSFFSMRQTAFAAEPKTVIGDGLGKALIDAKPATPEIKLEDDPPKWEYREANGVEHANRLAEAGWGVGWVVANANLSTKYVLKRVRPKPEVAGKDVTFKSPSELPRRFVAVADEDELRETERRLKFSDKFKARSDEATAIEAKPIDLENAAVVEGVRRALVELGLEERPAEEGKPIQFNATKRTLAKLKNSNVISLLPDGRLLIGQQVDGIQQPLEKAIEPKRK